MDKMVNLSTKELEKLEAILHKEAGLTLSSEKLQRFKRKIEAVIVEKKISDFSTFYHKLRFELDKELLEALINAVTVNETYFCRESEQFETLVMKILPKFALTKQERVRILIAPSSTGEELYSIMLKLIEEKSILEQLNIELVGIDIDSGVIQKAKNALYSDRSIEKLPKKFLKKYFEKVGNNYKLERSLVKSATFLQANIFDDAVVEILGEFDIVFSRNMLIYFNAQDKQRAFEQFHKLLKKNSYLFLGHADIYSIDRELFSVHKSGVHIFKKKAVNHSFYHQSSMKYT